MNAPTHIVDIYRKAGYPDPEYTASLAWGDVESTDIDDLIAASDVLETYCTRCRRTGTDARDVHFPLSDEMIQLCTDCEPNDIAVSSFELWH